MVLLIERVEFPYPAPRVQDIVEKIKENTGLTIECEYHHLESDSHREYAAKLYFSVLPKETFEVYTYCQGAIKEMQDKEEKRSGIPQIRCEGYEDREGKQFVYIQGYMAQDLTPLRIIILALVKLGGKTENNQYYLENFDRKITIQELLEKHKDHIQQHKKNIPFYILAAITTIIWIPIGIIWTVISFPFKLLWVYKQCPEIFRRRKSN